MLDKYELKPCPFCGSEPRFWEGEYCGISVVCSNDECAADTRTSFSRDEAIKRWNRRAFGWQPIETAPKDGSYILAWGPDFGCSIVRWFDERKSGPVYGADSINAPSMQSGWIGDNEEVFSTIEFPDGSVIKGAQPTHWMPLPEPPEVGEK